MVGNIVANRPLFSRKTMSTLSEFLSGPHYPLNLSYPHPVWRVNYINANQHLTVVRYDINAYTGVIDNLKDFGK